MTSNNNEINATLNGFIMSSVGSNSFFQFTNFVLYAVNNDMLFTYYVTF